MSASDAYLYDASLMPEGVSSPFLSKKTVYVLDSNAGPDYQGQIIYDFSSLSNSFSWIDWKSGVFEVPVSIVVENTSTSLFDMTDYINSYFCGLKAGTHHLINSISVNVNNTSVVSLQNNLNFYVQYKLLTELSGNDLKKLGATQFFVPDTSTSFHYASTRDGPGFTNNRPNINIAEDFSTQAFKAGQNAGFGERLSNVLDYGAGTTDAFYQQTINDTAKCTQNAISTFTTDGTQKAYFSILCTIRLRDVCDLFNEMGLTRGMYVNMIINLNSSKQTLTYTKNTETMTVSSINVGGLTNPLLISSAAANQPNAWLSAQLGAGETATIEVAMSVGTAKTTSGTSYTSPILGGKTRFQVDLYQMNPVYEERYLALKTKDVFYTDIYTYLYQNQISAGQSFNILASNGISRPTSVIVIPFVSKAANGTLTSVPIYQSPFASEPGTSSCIPITNFNVLLSGTAVFQQDYQYDYQQWLEELSRANAINGGQSIGFTSGLLSQKDFQFGYRFLVCDTQRRLPQDDIARSVEIRGTNNTNVPIDILVIIEYQRKLTYSISTGGLLTTV